MKKAIYIVYYYNSEEDKDFSWFVGEKENNADDMALEHLKLEYGDFNKEEIIDTFEISDRDILEVANS